MGRRVGHIGREGNVWWLGDVRAHWEQVFGPRTWTWLRVSPLFLFLSLSLSLTVRNSPNRVDEGPRARVSLESPLRHGRTVDAAQGVADRAAAKGRMIDDLMDLG